MIDTKEWEKIYWELYFGKPLEIPLSDFLIQQIGTPQRQISFLKNCIRWYKRDGEPSFRSLNFVGKGTDLYGVVKGVIDLFEVKIPMQLETMEESIEENELAANENTEKQLQFSKKLDYSNKEEYFVPDMIDPFRKIELEMLEREFLDCEGKWNTEKNKLAAFIYILKQLKYLRPKIRGKKERPSLLAYRRFFESRYNTDVAAQMKPSKFNIGTLRSYKPDFLFIPEIDNL